MKTESNNNNDFIPYDLNLRLAHIEIYGKAEIFRAYTYEQFFDELLKNKFRYNNLNATVAPYYYNNALHYGIKIWNIHGKIYYDCLQTKNDYSDKLFFKDLRDAQNQCITLIINLFEQYRATGSYDYKLPPKRCDPLY